MEPVSLMAIVPVAECNWPTVTVSSVTASPVVLTFAVGKSAVAGKPLARRLTDARAAVNVDNLRGNVCFGLGTGFILLFDFRFHFRF
jgi:hypothetical protein